MQVPVTQFIAMARIRRARLLPSNGQVLVRLGQKVSAGDTVARAEIPGEHLLINLRRGMQLRPGVKIEPMLERRPGDRLQAGDILAQKGRVFRRVVRTPSDGRLVGVIGGQVLIEKTGKTLDVHAGFDGTVVELIADRGAILETHGVLVQGVWGNGHSDQGPMVRLATGPDDELTPDRLDVSLRSTVAFAGHCNKAEVLKAAAMLPLRGLILSSMSADLVPLAMTLELPVILIEGFGRIPMNAIAFQLLSANEKGMICLNAGTRDLYTGERPEIIIPLPGSGESPLEMTPLESEASIRVVAGPHQGETGTLVGLPEGFTTLENRVRTMAARVKLAGVADEVSIPLANLEVIHTLKSVSGGE